MKKIVTLVSGGLDSTVMSLLIKEEGLEQHPLFVNYGQINLRREKDACFANFLKHDLPKPQVIELPGYGAFFSSGLTDPSKRILEDAFLPGRNMLFLLCAAALAHEVKGDAVAVGFLDERLSLFPDQRRDFADLAGSLLTQIMSRPIKILTPLISFSKAEVLAIAKDRGIGQTYSCHAGTLEPCGVCIACNEFIGLEV
jgi:7-cyano-7-deazaguanine synthase